MTVDPITAWMDVIAPDRGQAIAQAIETLPLRPVYPWLTDGEDNRPFCAEWSLRSSAKGIDRARVMVAANTDECEAGQLEAALSSLDGTSDRLRALADQLLAQRPDIDLLLGFALQESTPRAKLYILRPAGRPIEDFAHLSEEILTQADIAPEWTHSQIALAGQVPAFLALDLRSDGSSTGKLYFSFDHDDEVDRFLGRLKEEALRETLRRVQSHVSNNPVGRLVVTTRAAQAETIDVTLHAHLKSLPTLSPELTTAWVDIQALAQQHGSRPLRHSYASWLSGPTPAESLYYTFGHSPSD